MNGHIYASSMSASSTILTANTILSDNSTYYIIAQSACLSITLPTLVLSASSTVVNANRIFFVKNETSSVLTVAAAGGQTFEGGSSSITILPNRWAMIHGQNSLLRWNVYRVADLTATGVNDVTYAQLISMLGTTGASSATAGFYRVTDFRTAAYILGSSGGSSYVGTLEPLIVNVYYGQGMTASVPELDPRAFSPLWPQDIIWYDPYPANWIYDRSFCNTFDATSMVPNFKGVIYRRHDIKKDILGAYDWRNVLIRRWTFNAASNGGNFSGAIAYDFGDRVLGGMSLMYGPSGSLNVNQWASVFIDGICAIDPDDNPNYSPAGTITQELCVGPTANSATASTCATLTWTVTGYLDRLTFGTYGDANAVDPYAQAIDLGGYQWYPGSLTGGVANPTGSYNSIVNCNVMNATTTGGINSNRLNNVKLPRRAFGNSIYSAGFEEDNDVNNIQGDEMMINVNLNPYPVVPDSASFPGVNIRRGIRNMRFSRAKNVYITRASSDCEFGPIKDSAFESVHGIKMGYNTNTVAATGASNNGWSTGNVIVRSEMLEFNGVSNSLISRCYRTKFARSISKLYIHNNQGNSNIVDSQFSGDVSDCSFINSRVDNIHVLAAFKNNLIEGSTLRATRFGATATTVVIGPTSNVTECSFDGAFTASLIQGSVSNTRSAGTITTLRVVGGATVANTNFHTALSAVTVDKTLGTNAQILGSSFHGQSMAGCTFAGQVLNCEFYGNLSTNYFPSNLSSSIFMGGLTGSTGLGVGGTFTGAHVMGGAINGLNMSAATEAIANRGKLYMLSNGQKPYVLMINEAGGSATPIVLGATA